MIRISLRKGVLLLGILAVSLHLFDFLGAGVSENGEAKAENPVQQVLPVRPSRGYGRLCKRSRGRGGAGAGGGSSKSCGKGDNPWTSFIAGRKCSDGDTSQSGGFLETSPFARVTDAPIPPLIKNYNLQNVAKDNTGYRDTNWPELVFM